MLLADNGASVLRIDRAIPGKTHSSQLPPATPKDNLTRRKTSIALDLRSPSGIRFLKTLVRHADILMDPFRPGVLERLGIGPDVLLSINPRLIIGRLTGFRRDGRYKDMAGHDINYIAVSGALSMLGRKGEDPTPPVNVLGDFAGGGAVMFEGLLLALVARNRTGKGQVVEANMVDGSSYLMTHARINLKTPLYASPRGENMLDTGCPWYNVYSTKDGKHIAVGAYEPQFFAELVKGLGLSGQGLEKTRHDKKSWPRQKERFAQIFHQKTRSEWEEIFDGKDACVTPVLTFGELETDPSREGDLRPSVTLRDTPSLAVRRALSPGNDVRRGQGEGVWGDGYEAQALRPSENGEQTLQHWLGWSRGRDFDVQGGGLVLTDKDSKL
jgi:alpha-methylacyl-CoA racemase